MSSVQKATEGELYPELVAAGSLASALSRAATELGVDLGIVTASDSDPRRWAHIVSKSSLREPMGVGIGAVERWFIISAWSRGVQLLLGSTADLNDVVRAATAWREGLTLQEIQRAAPFLKVSAMAFAHERRPADAVDLKWHQLLQRAQAQDPEQLLPLAEAAAAEPRLRQLFPYTSHWTLLFSTCTGYPYSQDIPFIAPLDGNRYLVVAADREIISEADSAAEAISQVTSRLPENLGPAIAGTAEEPAA